MEVVGEKKEVRKKRSLRIWNSEIEKAIREKKIAYNTFLQMETPAEVKYRQKGNIAKSLKRRSHQVP